MMHYNESILHIFEIFNRNSVEYMVVGGTAVSFYGYDRPSTGPTGEVVATPDFDFWYNPTYTNYYHLLDALDELGKNVAKYRDEQSPNPGSAFFRLKFDDYTLDLLPTLAAPLSFSVAFARRNVFQQDGVEISFISFDDLIRDKEATARPKDKNDIEELRKVRPPQP